MSKKCWQSFVLQCVQGGIPIKIAKDMFGNSDGEELLKHNPPNTVENLSHIHNFCNDLLMMPSADKDLSITDLYHMIENENKKGKEINIFYSPCDEFEIYNILNWLLHPNWGGTNFNHSIKNCSSLHSIIHLLIEHGLPLTTVDTHIPLKSKLNFGDFIEYKDSSGCIMAGKIIDISLEVPPFLKNKVIGKLENQKWYLILPLRWSPKFAEWLPSSSIAPLTRNSRSFMDETILKRFEVYFYCESIKYDLLQWMVNDPHLLKYVLLNSNRVESRIIFRRNQQLIIFLLF